jgi:hypothetical protein
VEVMEAGRRELYSKLIVISSCHHIQPLKPVIDCITFNIGPVNLWAVALIIILSDMPLLSFDDEMLFVFVFEK